MAAFIVIAYVGAVWNHSFGPEFCSFYVLNHQTSVPELLNTYVSALGTAWYRPTSFNLPYWMLRHVLDWHNVIGWKFAQACTLIVAAWAIQWIALLLFPGRRLAAVLAACYFAVFPGCYSILLQNSAFDFLHIALAAGAAGCYLIGRGPGQPACWLGASAGLYLLALTSKEIAVVTPFYLAVVSAAGLCREESPLPLRTRVWRETAKLAPFVLLLGAYYFLHVRRMQPQPVDAAYRTEFNPAYILRNLASYPLWMARIYNATEEAGGQTAGHNSAVTNYSGLILLLFAFSQWLHDLRRDRTLRPPFFLGVAWAAVFAMVPVFSGGFLWHIDLAMAGYAILLGAGLERFLRSTSWPRAAAAGCMFLLLGLGWWSGASTLERGIHARQYQIGRQTLDGPLPVAESRIPRGALVYYEDRFRLGSWSFGGGDNLLKWRYLRPDLREKSVPGLSSMPGPLLAEWLTAPNAFYFVHDDEWRWRDFTAGFRKLAMESLPAYTNELLAQNRNRDVLDLLDPLLRRAELFPQGLLYYHHAVAAHRLRRPDIALESFGRAIELAPRYALAYLHRGRALADLGRKAQACQDYRTARELDPASEPARQAWSASCR